MPDKKIILTLAIVALLLISSNIVTANILEVLGLNHKSNDNIRYYDSNSILLIDGEDDVLIFDYESGDIINDNVRPNVDIKKLIINRNGKCVNMSLEVKGQIENHGDINNSNAMDCVVYFVHIFTNYTSSYEIFYVNNEFSMPYLINCYSIENCYLNISFNLFTENEIIEDIEIVTMDSKTSDCYFDLYPDYFIDNNEPYVEFVQPKMGLYLFNQKIRSFSSILLDSIVSIIGKITIKVNATDYESGIYKVDFYIAEELVKSDFDSPYDFVWNQLCFGEYNIKIVAYDNAGNTNSKELDVFKIL